MADRRVKIRFYAAVKRRVVDPPWPGGVFPVDWLSSGAPETYDRDSGTVVAGQFPGLSTLTYGTDPAGNDGTAYLVDPDADPNIADPDVFFMRLEAETEDYIHLRAWRVRRSQLPSKHDLSDGSTTPINLTKDQGLAEGTDIIVFVKTCIAAVVVNRAGLSMRSSLEYLNSMTGISMRLDPLHRKGALDLVRGESVSYVDIEVASGHFETLAEVSPDMGTAAKNVQTPGLKTIRVAFGAEAKDRSRFWAWWRPRAENLLNLDGSALKRLEVSHASAAEVAADTVDLLAQLIGLEATVPIDTGRTVDAEGARTAVLEGHNRHLEAIRAASDGLDLLGLNQRTKRPSAKGTVSPGVGTVGE